jgi:hypothetical protein
MYGVNLSGLAATLALIGLLTVVPATRAQEYASIQSQCRQEARDYGIEPEQLEEYVSGCVQAYGGVPDTAPTSEPDAQPADAEAPVEPEPDMPSSGDQDTGAGLE